MKPNLAICFLFMLGINAVELRTHAAESASGPAGHWEGNIQLPTTPLSVRVDLARDPGGAWSGTIDIPVQGLRGFKLDQVTVNGQAVSFHMPGIPGEPTFAGELDQSAKTLSGKFTQSGQTFPFKLERKTKSAASGETPSRGVPGKGLAGHWQGSLKPAPIAELRLVLEITNAPGGQLGGELISVDQGAARIPITSLTEKDGAVHLETESVGGTFEGTLSKDGSEIAGTWKQGGNPLPLTFKRLAKAPSFSRSQEPKKPYPYNEEEVAVPNLSAKIVLAGTLTWPKSPGRHPAAVLITGSGPQDRDEAIMGHRPFLIIADYLTRRGIAVLRCDDRGVAKSAGNFATATDTDFVEDTLAGVDYLKTRPEIDPKHIGLIGHSEGGIVAPVAAVKSSEVAFIVLLAGVGVPIEDLLVRQGRDIARVMGASDELLNKSEATQREMFHLVREEKDETALETRLHEIAKKQLAELSEEQRQALGVSDQMIEGQLGMVRTPWFRQLVDYDPRPTLKAVKCPVLALNGEKDLQVAAKQNLAAISDSLRAGGNQRVKTLELPGLNHLFQTCQTGAIAEYAQIDETFSPKALKIIADWILETVAR